MQRISSSVKQDEFSYQDIENSFYIYIYENETYIEPTEEEEGHYEYDFNHIIIPDNETVLFDRIQEQPSKYLNYIYKPVTPIEQMQADIEYLMLMVD